MKLASLNVDVLCTIFQNIDSDDLVRLCQLFPRAAAEILNAYDSGLVASIPDFVSVFRVLETVTYSRIVVTNTWQGLLKLLARAKRVGPLDLLAKYMYVPLGDFPALTHVLQRRLHREVPVKCKVIFVIEADSPTAQHRYSLLAAFCSLLENMPVHVLAMIRQIHLSIAQFGPADREANRCCQQFYRVIGSAAIHSSLEKMSLSGPLGHTQETANDVRFDFSNFKALRSLSLTNLGIVSLQELLLPETVTDLNLSNNHITSLDTSRLPPDLTSFDISHNHIDGRNAEPLPLTLKTLKLRRNLIENMFELPDAIQFLDISFNELPSSMFRMPAALQCLETDIAQYYLMSDKVRQQLEARHVVIRKKIASSIFVATRYNRSS